jgi:hypothetical protein
MVLAGYLNETRYIHSCRHCNRIGSRMIFTLSLSPWYAQNFINSDDAMNQTGESNNKSNKGTVLFTFIFVVIFLFRPAALLD